MPEHQLFEKDLFVARDEQSLCELFELMLRELFNINKPNSADRRLEKLSQLGVTSRLFRRWLQTTWGDRDWSPDFSGETPRQELAITYPGLNKGTTYFSIQTKKEGSAVHLKPLLMHVKTSEMVFLTGYEAVKAHPDRLVQPQLDVGFADFVEKLGMVEPPSDPQGYWNVFWKHAGNTLVSNIGLKIAGDKFSKLAQTVQEYLDSLLRARLHPDSYLQFDPIFYDLWDLVRQFDYKLPEYGLIEKRVYAGKKRNITYPMKVAFLLGKSFDEYILFPADRYFGAVDIVWTDRTSFVNEIAATIMYLDGTYQLKAPMQRDEELKRGSEPNDFWFSPPTAFRLLADYRYN